jgi:hypothetical protein
MSAFEVQVKGAILQDAKLVPANDKYPAKYQVKVIHARGDFYLSSAVVDLSVLPILQPVDLVAGCNRLSGAKSFHVIEVDALTCTPVVVTPAPVKK